MKKKSTIIPLALLAYLGVMAYVGLPIYREGRYLYYFGIVGVSLLVIFLLHLSLKRKERLQREREADMANTEIKAKDNNNTIDNHE
ncbi:MAG: hypothetical protein IKA19_03275 [Muribaculaceae bacterium]|nr:hypothetical protein [Muribaculaceae bacterium]